MLDASGELSVEALSERRRVLRSGRVFEVERRGSLSAGKRRKDSEPRATNM